MKKHILLFVILLSLNDLSAQYISGKFTPDKSQKPIMDFSDWSYKLSTTITENDIKEHIFTLASDEFEGRETGTEGNLKAANYIADKFEKLGLPKIGENNSYFQKIAFTFSSWKDTYIANGDKEYKLLRDFIAFPQFSKSETKNDYAKLVFAGYGIETDSYSDYNTADVNGAAVMVYDGEPMMDNLSLITHDETVSDWSTDWQKKSLVAKQERAELLIIVSNDLKEMINNNRRLMVNRITQLGDYGDYIPEGVNTVFISPAVAQEILGDNIGQVIASRDKVLKGEPFQAITLNSDISIQLGVEKTVLAGQNVLGLIEGSDKKDEVVVVSAHYDHIGMRGEDISNGADDDASGTTAVLEIAEALATAKKMKHGPSRSVLCLLVTGEEKGLLGSAYYAEHPIFPTENTIVDVNIDMIGRTGEEYQGKNEDYIYVIGSDRLSTDLHKISEASNQKYSQLLYDYKYNDEADPNRFYFRSDHYNFAKNGIPAIFFFNGVHEDYHRPTDTPDKIEIPLMTKRAKSIFHLVWDLANRKDRIIVDGEIK